MVTYWLCFILIAVYFVHYILKDVRKPANYPPGPQWYPFFGSSNVVQKMIKQYGSQYKALSVMAKELSTDILGLKLGSEWTVVVSGEHNMREVFMRREFDGRPDSYFLKLRCFGISKSGITFSDGELWKEHRKFTVKELKNVGFGKTLMEAAIQEEAQCLIRTLYKNGGASVNPRLLLGPSVMNVLWKYVAGETIAKARLDKLLELLHARSRAFVMTGGWLNQFPWIRFFFPELSGYALIQKINNQLREIIDEAIDKHKKKEIDGSDFIYSFLQEMAYKKDTFTDDQLRVICLDLLIAGSQTTSNMLEFALLTVLRDVNIQNRIFEEINNNIGSTTPCWNDSHKLMYTSSFLLEVQRYYTITPLAGPRKVLWDTTLGGYYIPKGTTILMSVGDIHSNPDLWKNPEDFIPDRFLNHDGTLVNPERNFYPFGSGRRRCPGDSLAKSFVFIVFVSLMQNFLITPSNGKLPCAEPTVGLLAAPKQFTATFIPRS